MPCQDSSPCRPLKPIYFKLPVRPAPTAVTSLAEFRAALREIVHTLLWPLRPLPLVLLVLLWNYCLAVLFFWLAWVLLLALFTVLIEVGDPFVLRQQLVELLMPPSGRHREPIEPSGLLTLLQLVWLLLILCFWVDPPRCLLAFGERFLDREG